MSSGDRRPAPPGPPPAGDAAQRAGRRDRRRRRRPGSGPGGQSDGRRRLGEPAAHGQHRVEARLQRPGDPAARRKAPRRWQTQGMPTSLAAGSQSSKPTAGRLLRCTRSMRSLAQPVSPAPDRLVEAADAPEGRLLARKGPLESAHLLPDVHRGPGRGKLVPGRAVLVEHHPGQEPAPIEAAHQVAQGPIGAAHRPVFVGLDVEDRPRTGHGWMVAPGTWHGTQWADAASEKPGAGLAPALQRSWSG